MSFALMAGVTGLQAHQRMLDVAGNNLANINTIGFKSSKIVFSELLSQILKRASQPTSTIGGVNPQQIGSGVQVASISPDTSQGNLVNTNSPLDLAVEGEGYFVVNDGSQNLYTRAGSFAVDASSNLVDPATGYLVQRFGTVGEADNFQTAGISNTKVRYDISMRPSKTTELVVSGNLSADAALATSQTQVLRSDITFTVSGANATGSTEFDQLDDFTGTFSGDGLITISGKKPDGTNLGATPTTILTMAVNASTTITNLLTHLNTDDGGSVDDVQTLTRTVATTQDDFTITINSQTTGAIAWDASLTDIKDAIEDDLAGISDVTVTGATMNAGIGTTTVFTFGNAQGDVADMTFTWGTSGGAGSVADTATGRAMRGVLGGLAEAEIVNGKIVVTDAVAGFSQSDIKLVYSDTGDDTALIMPGYFEVATVGGAQVKSFNIIVYDANGGEHVLSGAFTRTGTNSNLWDLVLSSISGDINELTFDNRRIRGISFNGGDGSYAGLDVGIGDTARFIVTFSHDTANPQTIAVDMGTQGLFDGLTQFARPSTAVAKSQDGYTTGDLSSVSVSNEGYIIGAFTNGLKKNLAQIQLALFSNPSGLESVGNGYFTPSVNSGIAVGTQAMVGGSGTIHGSSLEKSNADVASLFVSMIEAQNGYHANARTIKIANDMLKELTNLIR